MLDYNDIKPKKVILLDDEPYQVLTAQTKKKNRQKPSNQTKLKNLVSGAVIEKAFHQSDRVEEAELQERSIKYLFFKDTPASGKEWWFCAADDPSDRFALSAETIGPAQHYLQENVVYEAMVFDDEIIGIDLPAKIDVAVVEAPPNVKGNTSSGGTKPVTVETGAIVDTPLFIEVGDTIRINTETGLYSERVAKA